jgi:hypothetical protein
VAIFEKNPHTPHRKRAIKEKISQSALNVIGLNYIIAEQAVLMREYDYAWDKNIRDPFGFMYSWFSKFRTILQSY